MALDTLISILTFTLVALFVLTPLTFLGVIYIRNKFQTGHSILRKHPILGVMRYVIEKLGPEFRFYITDSDNEGTPFSRMHFTSIVFAAKYCKTVIGFGSKRDFREPGFYLNNALFPRQMDEMAIDNRKTFTTHKYDVVSEGIFTRKQRQTTVDLRPWMLTDEDAIVFGPNRKNPYVSKSWFGCSAMSYGSLGAHAIEAINRGIAMTGSGWHNTGEGGISPFHLKGADIIAQLGSGKFGFRTPDGSISWDLVAEKAAIPQVKMFEIKLHQGAKIKGGHLEGVKVTPEIAAIRGVQPWKTISSPNRFSDFNSVDELLDFVSRFQEVSGKPVGVKVVMGSDLSLDELCARMKARGEGPDFITVDGGEGGSGATYQEMADSMGLPVFSGLVLADNALQEAGIRDRVKLIASGKLHSADQICIALGVGADAVNIARGFMIAVGCIMTEKCHTGTCPVGVATNDPAYMSALVVEEKQYRVANYITTIRAACFSLAAACGVTSPVHLTRQHVVYKYGDYRVASASTLFQS